jgi:hypothetical protein
VNRPLLHGSLLDDPDLLGKPANSTDTARDDRHGVVAPDYLGLLAHRGLLRDDMSVDEMSYAYQATFGGFLRAEGAAPAAGQEQRADLLARTVQRAFENESAIPAAALQDLASATVTLLGDLIDADRTAPGIHES